MAKLTESVNFRLTPEEKQIWLQYCDMTARTQNDVFRDYLRTLAKKLSKKAGASVTTSNPATLDPHSSQH
jgi:TRAP-type C4-dicarboxylate transport system substrate-binding protein